MVTKSVKRKPLVSNLKSVKPTVFSVPERIRTSDLPLRRRSLYPAELREQMAPREMLYCPLGGGCYIHLTMRAKSGLCSISRRFLFYPVITDIFSKHRLYLISPKEGLSRCGRSGHRQQSGNRLVF